MGQNVLLQECSSLGVWLCYKWPCPFKWTSSSWVSCSFSFILSLLFPLLPGPHWTRHLALPFSVLAVFSHLVMPSTVILCSKAATTCSPCIWTSQLPNLWEIHLFSLITEGNSTILWPGKQCTGSVWYLYSHKNPTHSSERFQWG